MEQGSRRIIFGLVIAFVTLIILLIGFGNIVGFYTDWLWFADMGQLGAYLPRLWTRVALWLIGAVAVLITLAVSWYFIPRRLFGRFRLRLKRGEKWVTIGAGALNVILAIIALLIAMTMAAEAAENWMTFLTFRHAQPFDLSDPIFGRDVGFYIFKLPFYRFLNNWLMGLIVVTLMGNTMVYSFSGRVREAPAIGHLSVLGALFLVSKAAGYQIQRLALLDSSRGVVFGAGYTDVNARLPLFQLLTAVVIFSALLLLVNIFVRRWRWLLIAGGVWLALTVAGPVYPTMVQRFSVEPNELAMERPYIEHNIHFTRYAYGLDEIEEADFRVTGELTGEKLEDNQNTLDNVRLWDWKPLRTTYEQLQEIRTYYTFTDVDIDRYVIDGRLRQVTLAARELSIEQMREDARTWINEHLVYTHGYGLCLSPVAEVSEEGLPHLLVRDIPPQSLEATLVITRPEIYFGEKTTNYVIVNTGEDEFDYPKGDENVYVRYEGAGAGGVKLGGLLRHTAFALRFNSTPILISKALSSESRILFHRALPDRVETLAPMLWYDADPYPVIVDGRIVWLYDAYTWSKRFPYSEPTGGLNYIRNSVKVAIDAYSGETTFYVVDPDDPLIQTYRSIFPELFVSGDEMDPVLREHWRYPEQLFRIQAERYGAYHMQDPRVFYNQEDLWQTPMEVREAEETEMSPYYVTARLPGTEAIEFMMIRPYVPAGKQNMIAWLYADSDGPDYGRLGVYKFSKEALVYGPMQVEARVDQNPAISQQLTLWNQRGSSVIRGNLIVIPIDGTLLYIEPLYLQAESGRLPELKRVIVAHGNRIAMAKSLASGLAQVLGEEPLAEPGEGAGGEVLSTDAAELALSAQAHYEAAQECLRLGDWTCYGEELDALERALEALVVATGGDGE
jgi:uncharacterized protein